MTAPAQTPILPATVITTCYGRNRHLYHLLASLEHGSKRPAEVIVVNDDADPNKLAAFDLNIVHINTVAFDASAKTGFDIGRNRNAGAAHASYDMLVFLDVDCIVHPDFMAMMVGQLQANTDALLMGQPRYLTRSLDDTESAMLLKGECDPAVLDELSVLNPYRVNFEQNAGSDETSIIKTQDYGAFWSLCFAILRAQFDRIGGFDTGYIGYGAEDTDFAFMAQACQIDFYLINAVVYHQQHRVYRPPVNHLSSIVMNANRFYDKWHHWPMAGWLAEFADMGLILWQKDQHTPITVIRTPSRACIAAACCEDAPYV